MAAAPKTKKQPKPDQTITATPTIGKSDIKRSALEAWRKLDTVIQNELSLIMNGQREITASTAAAVIKFIEASADLASGSEDLSPKDKDDRQQALMEKIGKLPFPTFDDADDDEEDQWAINKQ
ncbi:hypothetical protein JJB98_18640 [Bradyrhizobium diazoefficiens]|nr:hypothetical protein [Bradyrhizobium diazoefficiens]QQO21811.1 hypothetical protein JJB98_18640 [Bradyrhizobium diazoefficiens]